MQPCVMSLTASVDQKVEELHNLKTNCSSYWISLHIPQKQGHVAQPGYWILDPSSQDTMVSVNNLGTKYLNCLSLAINLGTKIRQGFFICFLFGMGPSL